MRCGTHTIWMCYLEDKQNLKYKKNRKTYIQPVGYPHMAPDSLRRYLQVPPSCQGALNWCLLPAPPPGSRQFEGQIQSADCRPFHDWLKKMAYSNLYQYDGGKSLPVCMFLYFILHIFTYFLEEKGYVVGTLRMLNWGINRFMTQILRIMLLTCN